MRNVGKLMVKMMSVIAVMTLLLPSAANAGVVLDVDFDAFAYDSIADLQADGWSFTGQEGTNVASGYDIRWQNGEKTLYLDGGPGHADKPSATKGFGQSISLGTSDFRWSHTASYSNSELRFLDGSGTTVFSVGLDDDTKIKFYNAGSTVSHTIADNTSSPTTVHLEWDAVAGTYSYNVNAGAFTGTLNFLNTGTPEAIKYILNNNTNGAREVFLYELTVAEVPEPATLMLLGLGGMVLIKKRR